MSTFKSWKYVFIGKKHVICHGIVQENKLFKDRVKSFRHKKPFLSRMKPISSLVSTLEFVLDRDVQVR